MNARACVLVASSLAACGDSVCDPNAPNTICTIVGAGSDPGYRGDGEAAVDAWLYTPLDAALSPEGELWLLDFNNYVVRSVDSAGVIRTRIGTGELNDSPPVGMTQISALEAGFNHTTDLLFHDGYLYLADWHNSRVKRVNLSTSMLENFAGIGSRTLYTGDDGPALTAALDLPSSITLDPNNDLVVMDQANQVIRRIDQSGNIHRIAGSCVVDREMPCATGEMPTACPGSNKLVCGSPETECTKSCSPGFDGDGGSALELRMAQPAGATAPPAGRVAYDPAGNLLFADTNNNRIRKVDLAGIVTTIAGTGAAGYSGDDGPAAQADLYQPTDIAVAADGTIYFTDVYNNCVRKIDTAGIISSVVGTCSSNPIDRGFAGDGGPPLEAKLDRPYGIALDGKKLYVCDSYNNRVRVVNLP